MLTTTLLYAGLLPLVASAAIGFVMRRRHCRPEIIWAVAVGCGFLAGHVGLKSRAGFDDAIQSFVLPHEAVDWLPLVVLVALGASVVMEIVLKTSPVGRGQGEGSNRRRIIALAVALALAVPVRLLSGNVRLTHDWSAIERLAYLALLSATLGLVWLLLAFEGDERENVVRAPLLTLVAVGAAVVLHHSGTFMYAQSCGTVAAASAGTALAWMLPPPGSSSGATGSASVWRRPSFPGIKGAAGVITFSLGSLILLGHFYAELPATNAALIFLSLAATGAPLPAFIQRDPTWHPIAARTVLCVLPLAIALISVVA